MFWDVTHEDLDKKIGRLESRILSSQSIFGHTRDEWDTTFELMKEIQADFSKVRYPTKDLRKTAWQNFCSLRSDAHEKSRQSSRDRSDRHMIDINYELRAADWDAFEDKIGDAITFGTMRTTKEMMKEKGQHLHEAGQLLSKYKHEMTREHKDEVFERIKRIREQHNIFWGRAREYHEENQRAFEQRQKEFEEKRDRARASIEANVDKNRDQLRKAEDALERHKQNREKIRDQISSAYSDGFRDRAEGWLDEENDKIEDIEGHIERIEGWIEEGRSKLNKF